MHLNYRIQGTGFPIILVHGLFGDLDNLNGVNKALAKHFKTITVDVRNHGLSPQSDAINYELMAQDILDLADQLQIEKFAILGHSMGGKIALKVAGLGLDRVSAVIAADIAPVAYQEDRHDNIFKGLNAVTQAQSENRREADKTLQQHVKILGVRQFLLKSFDRDNPTRWRFNVEALQNHYSDIIAWNDLESPYLGPTLFIKGALSDYLITDYQNAVTQQFPNAQVKVIADTGHWLHAEKPDIFNRIALDFLLEKL